jgi:hypothetical protein
MLFMEISVVSEGAPFRRSEKRFLLMDEPLSLANVPLD